MCIACLKLLNHSILAKINDKRNAVLEHKKEFFNSKSMTSSNLKIEYLVRISYALTAQLKTSNKKHNQSQSLLQVMHGQTSSLRLKNKKLFLMKKTKN